MLSLCVWKDELIVHPVHRVRGFDFKNSSIAVDFVLIQTPASTPLPRDPAPIRANPAIGFCRITHRNARVVLWILNVTSVFGGDVARRVPQWGATGGGSSITPDFFQREPAGLCIHIDTIKTARCSALKIYKLLGFTFVWWWSAIATSTSTPYRWDGYCYVRYKAGEIDFIAYSLSSNNHLCSQTQSTSIQWLPNFFRPIKTIALTSPFDLLPAVKNYFTRILKHTTLQSSQVLSIIIQIYEELTRINKLSFIIML